VDSKGEEGQTPLWWTMVNRHKAVVQQQLDKTTDLDVNYKDRIHGQTALWWAARNRHEAVIQKLLEKRTDLEATLEECRKYSGCTIMRHRTDYTQ
jgi:ankyrin repeat protein